MRRFDLSRSSALARAEYDDEKNELTIHFKIGAVYRFFLVPPHVVEELSTADSPGRIFTSEIRGRYPHEEVG